MKIDLSDEELKIFIIGLFGASIRALKVLFKFLCSKVKIKFRHIAEVTLTAILVLSSIYLSIMLSRCLKLSFEASIILAYLTGYLSRSFFNYLDKNENNIFKKLIERVK